MAFKFSGKDQDLRAAAKGSRHTDRSSPLSIQQRVPVPPKLDPLAVPTYAEAMVTRDKFKPEYVMVARNLALLGLTEDKIAIAFGVEGATINAWKRRIPAFRQALEDGGVLADAAVAASFYQRALGYDAPIEKIFYDSFTKEVVRAPTHVHIPADVGAARTWLAGRQPDMWAIRAEVDVKVSVTDARERNMKLIEAVAMRELPTAGSADD